MNKKPTQLILTVLLALALAYLTAYAGAWWNTKRALRDISAGLAPFAGLTYNGIGLSVGGDIAVRDLTITPRMVPDVITIDRLKLYTPGVHFLLGGQFKRLRERGVLEAGLGVGVVGLSLSADGSIVAQLLESAREKLGTRPEGLGCSLAEVMSMVGDVWYEVAPIELILDFSMTTRSSVEPDLMTLVFDYAQRDFIEMSVETDVPARFSVLGAAEAFEGSPMRVTLRYDEAYLNSALQYCAATSDMDVSTFLNAALRQSDKRYMADLGFVPGEGLRRVLARALKGSTIEVEFQPPEDLTPNAFKLFRPEDIPRLLRLRVSVDGAPVEDVSIRSAEPARAVRSAPASSSKLPATATQRAAVPGGVTETPRGKLAYPDLKRCVGCTIAITFPDGREVVGQVIEYAEDQLVIEQWMRSGSLRATITRHDVMAVKRLN